MLFGRLLFWETTALRKKLALGAAGKAVKFNKYYFGFYTNDNRKLLLDFIGNLKYQHES